MDSEIINEIASTGYAWIRQRKQPLRTEKSSLKTASTGDAWIQQCIQPLWSLKSSMKLHPRVTHGFDSANSRCGMRNLQQNCCHG
jgi:hypothetical protein